MADYRWSYEMPADGAVAMSAEAWLRACWEGGPALLRGFLTLAWKYGLGLRLGSPTDATRVLGWKIAESTPTSVTVVADSRLLRAENTISVQGGRVCWRTVVAPNNAIGRVLWLPASIVHQCLVPRSLRRVIRIGSTPGN